MDNIVFSSGFTTLITFWAFKRITNVAAYDKVDAL